MPALKLRHMTNEMHSSLKLLITLTFLVISLPNQHMEFSYPNSFIMLGSAVWKMIWSKGWRASQKTNTESLHLQWSQVISEEMSDETSLDRYQTGPKTSLEPHRIIMINILEIFYLITYYSLLLLGNLESFYLLLKQAHVQLDELTPVIVGLTLHSCYCN